MIKVTKYKKYALAMHLFKVLLQNDCLVPFSKPILHYKNILVSTSFEHVQYNE